MEDATDDLDAEDDEDFLDALEMFDRLVLLDEACEGCVDTALFSPFFISRPYRNRNVASPTTEIPTTIHTILSLNHPPLAEEGAGACAGVPVSASLEGGAEYCGGGKGA